MNPVNNYFILRCVMQHMCHVFRCDVPARAIANTLRDICKKILIERSLAQSSSKLIGAAAASSHHENKGQHKYKRVQILDSSLYIYIYYVVFDRIFTC